MTSPETKKTPVAILGATGSVGQRFVELLASHPWFEIAELCASPANEGRRYGDVTRWLGPTPLPERIAGRVLRAATAALDSPLVFSALDAKVAGEIEAVCARAGKLVVTNAASHRMDSDVPLLVPEINPDHLELLERQGFPAGGGIVANPNCSTIGLVLALAPLARAFGVARVHVVTLQALSGAGLPGVSSLEVIDNVIPHIPGEEEKMAVESKKILGRLTDAGVEESNIVVSAQCNRVPVLDGHLQCVSMELSRAATRAEILSAWRAFAAEPQERRLPSAPSRPVVYLDEESAPQPRKHRDLERGMAATIGRLQPCPVLGWRFVTLSHNTLRGAAGGAVLTAELAANRGLI